MLALVNDVAKQRDTTVSRNCIIAAGKVRSFLRSRNVVFSKRIRVAFKIDLTTASKFHIESQFFLVKI